MRSEPGYGETVTTPANGWQRLGKALRVAVAAGVGLALVGVLSAGAVFGARRLGPGATSHHAVQAAAGHNPAAAVAPAGNSSPAPAATIYLVGSPDQAAVAQAGIDTAEQERLKLGGAATAARVFVVRSAGDEAAQRSMIADENGLRASLGLAEITLVDLR
ncbi:MAG TPA: hypothetical protein VKV26_14210 [Dehalococcoidia bacterium]|nr:hypothetical protein [Dehalococcoidia bacterium]